MTLVPVSFGVDIVFQFTSVGAGGHQIFIITKCPYSYDDFILCY